MLPIISELSLEIKEETTILDCLEKIESNAKGFIIALDQNQKVSGLLTDGDIRRAFIEGAHQLDNPKNFVNTSFSYVKSFYTREEVLKIFDCGCKFIPIIDDSGKPIDIIFPEMLHYRETSNLLARGKAPVRISFGGGGTDLTSYFSDFGGAVFNATINLYAHCSLKKRLDSKIIIMSHDFNQMVEFSNIDEMIYNGNLDLIKAVINLLKPKYGFELEIYCDFPLHSGLGGSSAVVSAVISAFNQFREDKLNSHEIAEMAFQAERIELAFAGGWQDQYATVFGGFNFIEFNSKKNEVFSLKLNQEVINELEERLLVCFSGKEHPVGQIHNQQKKEMKKNHVVEYAHRTREIAYEMKSLLLRGEIDSFGLLLDESWELKKKFANGISDEFLDEIYNSSKLNGAIGGKIMGAGGGGFFLFQSHAEQKARLTKFLKEKGLIVKDFIFEMQGVRSWTVRVNDLNQGY